MLTTVMMSLIPLSYIIVCVMIISNTDKNIKYLTNNALKVCNDILFSAHQTSKIKHDLNQKYKRYGYSIN